MENIVFSGANAEVYIIPYISTDSSNSEFIPVKDFLTFKDMDSFTVSSARSTNPVFPLGKQNATGYVEGPEINRVKLSFSDNNVNPFIELFDFMLKSKYDDKGYRKNQKSNIGNTEFDLNLNSLATNNIDRLITEVGTLSGTTTNPFDIWMYVEGEYVSLTTVVFGVKIDTSTVARDVYNKNLRLAEGIALNSMENFSGRSMLDFMMNTKDYANSVGKIMDATNKRASLPLKNTY